MKYVLLVLLCFLSLSAVAADEMASPCPDSFAVFKKDVHPFLRKNCAGCHGDEGKDFDRLEFMAPPHSVSNPLTSYMKTRGYLNLAAPDKSRLVLIGENGHCVDKGGDEGCGAKPGEISKIIAKWVGVEKTCANHSNIVASLMTPKEGARPLSSLVKPKSKPSKETNYEEAYSDVMQVAMGDGHVCVIVDGGRVKCWGQNGSYQAGDFTTTDGVLPSDMPKDSFRSLRLGARAVQIGAGASSSCALLETGVVKCWGSNDSGELGAYDIDDSPAFHKINLGVGTPIKLAMGYHHACVVMDYGDVKCWGEGVAFKTLGYREEKYERTDWTLQRTKNKVIPSLNFGGRKAKNVFAGASQTCALFEDDKLICWGERDLLSGKDGSGEMPLLSKIQPIPLGLPVIYASVGEQNACAVLVDGSLKCWGEGRLALNGQDNAVPIFTAEEIKKTKPVKLGAKVKIVALGTSAACALLETGEVKCWGTNQESQFGSGESRDFVGFEAGDMASLRPAILGTKAVYVTSNYGSSFCALVNHTSAADQTLTRRLKCWGSGSSYVLGQADELERGKLDFGEKEALPFALIFKDVFIHEKKENKE